MMTLSVVSPVYNEKSGLGLLLDALEDVLLPLALSFEVILVDDGSSDGTWEGVREESARRPWLRALRLSRNFGKEAALAAGIDAARGRAVITMDSDLQHPPALIPDMVRLWLEGKADIVEAQKEKRQREFFFSRLCARFFYSLFARLAPFDLESASDFKLMDRKAVDAWQTLGERRLFFRGMSKWLGFSRETLFFRPPERETGHSKWSFNAKCLLALDSLSAFSTRPLAFIWIGGFFFFLFSLLVGGEALLMKMQGKAVTGFTTVILLQLITCVAVLGAVCLLSLYIRQIFYEVKNRPRYLLGEVLDATAAMPRKVFGVHRRARGGILGRLGSDAHGAGKRDGRGRPRRRAPAVLRKRPLSGTPQAGGR